MRIHRIPHTIVYLHISSLLIDAHCVSHTPPLHAQCISISLACSMLHTVYLHACPPSHSTAYTVCTFCTSPSSTPAMSSPHPPPLLTLSAPHPPSTRTLSVPHPPHPVHCLVPILFVPYPVSTSPSFTRYTISAPCTLLYSRNSGHFKFLKFVNIWRLDA